MVIKKCSKCGKEGLPVDFEKKGRWCKKCANEYERLRRKEDKIKNPNKYKLKQKEYLNKYPWVKTKRSISQKSKRKDRLWIKNYLSIKDLKDLWFRDNAFNLKHPSLDRIDPTKDYTLDNCRYIELSENSRRVRYMIVDCCPRCGFKNTYIDPSYPDQFKDKCKQKEVTNARSK